MMDTEAAGRAGGTDRTDAILEGIKTQRRRRILCHLRRCGSTTLTKLVDVVETETDRTDEVQRGLTHSSLFRLDVPKLECLGLVTFDPVGERVGLAVERREIDGWLDLAIRMDLGGEITTREESTAGDHREILIVEDDPDSAELIAYHLQSADEALVVTTVSTVEAAMRVLQNRSVDGIISDLRLPAISGLDLLRLVRTTDPDCPFVLFTGCDREESAVEALEADVTGFVRKSANPDQFAKLAHKINSAVEAR